MYANQMMSERMYYNPAPWCLAFKDSSGNPIKVGVQQDAEEYVNKFLEKVEDRFAGTPQAGLVRDCFEGTLADQRVAPVVGYKAEGVNVFKHWGLEPKGFETLEASL